MSTNRKYPKEIIKKTTPLVKERIKKLSEYQGLAGFFFKRVKPKSGLLGDDHQAHLTEASVVLKKVDDWTKAKIDKALIGTVKKNNFQTGKFFMDLRVAIAGSKVTPPINDSIVILGKEETLKRLKLVLSG